MSLVLIGVWAFFWRVEAQKQGANRFQVYNKALFLEVGVTFGEGGRLRNSWVSVPILY